MVSSPGIESEGKEALGETSTSITESSGLKLKIRKLYEQINETLTKESIPSTELDAMKDEITNHLREEEEKFKEIIGREKDNLADVLKNVEEEVNIQIKTNVAESERIQGVLSNSKMESTVLSDQLKTLLDRVNELEEEIGHV